MLTREKFNSLCAETQKECRNTLAICKKMGECAPDEWDRIVAYYYERDNQPPEGWFVWWD